MGRTIGLAGEYSMRGRAELGLAYPYTTDGLILIGGPNYSELGFSCRVAFGAITEVG